MKFLAVFALFAVAYCVPLSDSPFDSELDEFWLSYKKLYEKVYSLKEDVKRRLIWEQNVADVVRHNLHTDLGVHSYKRGINKFSDMTAAEHKMWKGFKLTRDMVRNGSAWLEPMNVELPATVDWREKGYVTEVKDQGQCGSCWAFSTTGSLEGQHFRKTGKLVSLSEQNLVDCARAEGNEGCDGGWVDYAFNYVIHNHGIDTEKSYPYKAENNLCHFKKANIGATCTGYVDLPEGDEEALKKAVATIGPISVAINAGDYFSSYQSGVFDNEDCGNKMEDLNHGVLLVGYGTEGGKDYWLIKNSWGPKWGLHGYIKMSRNKNNQCGIGLVSSYPLV